MDPVSPLLTRWLRKMGISDYYSMNEEEKLTYSRLEQTLRGRAHTDAEVAEFWRKEVLEIQLKLTSPDLNQKQEWFLRCELRLALKYLDFIQTPEKNAAAARLAIEQQLQV